MSELGTQFADSIHNISPENPHSGIILHYSQPMREYIQDSPEQWNAEINKLMLQHGAIVFRGFKVDKVEILEKFVSDISNFGRNSLIPYEGERASPRSLISSYTYTSTEYEATNSIFIHNEMSSRMSWPRKLYFYCHKKSEQGGNTPICNIRKVTQDISDEVVDLFKENDIKYIRNYGGRFGVNIEYGFGTKDKSEVEKYCDTNDIQYEWIGDEHLRTSFCRPAFETHPISKEELWFNYATFYDVNSVDAKVSSLLKRMTKPEERSFAAMFANGETISDEIFDYFRSLYTKYTYEFDWANGDILALDNMLYGHGRQPYSGERSVWVVMAEETHRTGANKES